MLTYSSEELLKACVNAGASDFFLTVRTFLYTVYREGYFFIILMIIVSETLKKAAEPS